MTVEKPKSLVELKKENRGLRETIKVMEDAKLYKAIVKARKNGSTSSPYVPLVQPISFESVVATAKTFSERIEEAIQCCIDFPYYCINCDKECGNESLVSLGLVLQLRDYWVGELHKLEKAKELANKENVVVPYMDGCISLLKEVFSAGSGEKKEGDDK